MIPFLASHLFTVTGWKLACVPACGGMAALTLGVFSAAPIIDERASIGIGLVVTFGAAAWILIKMMGSFLWYLRGRIDTLEAVAKVLDSQEKRISNLESKLHDADHRKHR